MPYYQRTSWLYSDGGPNWLAECVTLAYEQDLPQLMRERVFRPIGIGNDDLTWRTNAYRPSVIRGIARREFGSGVHANVDAMARIGLLYLRHGRWQDQQLIPKSFVQVASNCVDQVVPLPEHVSEHGNASAHYGLLWWNNADGTIPLVPKNTFWSWGLYDSLIVVMPEHQIVVARAGKSWPREEGSQHYAVLAPLLQSISAAASSTGTSSAETSGATPDNRVAPYPPSPVIANIKWDAATSVFRFPRSCYRSGLSYNAGLKRYLWCQILPESSDRRGPRFAGGFGIYDAPTPWGPWTTAFFTPSWDVGPGETSSIPTKWIQQDGRAIHLVFSGDDAFSVRRGMIETQQTPP